LLLFSTAATAAFAQVETVGDVSLAVPDGWTFKRAANVGTVALSSGQNFWTMAVHGAMPSSGDPTNDLKAAWTRIVLAGNDYRGMPAAPYYDIRNTLGYPSRRAEDSNVGRSALTRMYVLETGTNFIPVVLVSRNRSVMDAMEHVALAFIGSVRQAPLRAQPLKYSISIADLTGHWQSGAATSRDFYNSQTGRYEGNATSFFGAGYTIASDGNFTYRMSGKGNGSTVREQESGMVELGGELVIFKGQTHVKRYRFINFQHSLDGASVLTLLPENSQVNASSIINYGERWTRTAQGK
jgi:hypothetical protein